MKLRHHGDVLLTSPFFTSLKRAYPTAQIDAYIYKETLPMLDGHPAIDRFHLYDKGWKKSLARYLKEAKLLYQIRKSGYDLIFNLTEGDRGALAALVSGAKYRIGVDPKGSGMKGKRKIFTHFIPEYPEIRHTVETNLDALRAINIFPSVEDRFLTLHIPKEVEERMTKLVPEEYILVHPVSRWMFKAWPSSKMHAMIKHLLSQNHNVVLTSGPAPDELAFAAQVKGDLPITDLTGKTSLKELAALIKNARAMITVDSVPMHMSAAFQTPLVAIYGPTSEIRWAPWQHARAQIVTSTHPCRPCYQAGCNNSGVSECLETLSLEAVLSSYNNLGID